MAIKTDKYNTVTGRSEGEFREKGSKFLSYAYPVYNAEEIAAALADVRKIHPKSRHQCYAWRLGIDKNNYRTNDDGEPSGTAGRPILGQLDSYQVTNTIVIVVRYFGGTLLGTSGLINAFRTASSEALKVATIVEKTVEDIYRLDFDYAIMSDVMNAVKKLKLEIVNQSFTEVGLVEIAIPQSQVTETIRNLRSLIAKVRIEEIDAIEVIEHLEINYTITR